MKTKIISQVLIAIDFDPTAQLVAEQGLALAKSLNAEITLLHVTSETVNYYSPQHVTVMGFVGNIDSEPSSLQFDVAVNLKKVAQKYLNKTKQHLADKTIKTIVKEGETADTIIEIANTIKADVIVMGSHSQKWLENIIMGSVSEKVLRQTTIPLYIVPTKKRE
jgi:nucleotide-binding universal stress UspA family protein